MRSSNFALLMVLVLVGSLLGGCCRGMKVTFINETDAPVDAEFLTQGGPDQESHTRLGTIDPGEDKSACKRFDEEMLPSNFSITIDGGTPDTLTEIIEIPVKYFDEIEIYIRPDEELGRVIEIVDEDGKAIEKK
jgi:hypothetical protein